MFKNNNITPNWLHITFAIIALLFHPDVYADTCESNSIFKVGAGIYDITGPAAEEGMMGYGMLNQKTTGLLQRLWARAFVIESPCSHRRVVFVNADLGQIFQGIKQGVIAKLQQKHGNQYTDENVLLTATHTHSGPGGYSTYAFYNLTTLGFSRENFNTIVDGIVRAIERAETNIKPAHIRLASGELDNISYNRSNEAYLLNPQGERQKYKNNFDTTMTLLRFDTLDGKPIGMINWFPLHGVSLNNKNTLIAGDNKGFAEYRFEQDFHSDYGKDAFVAAFAQAHSGDVSPNPVGHEGGAGIEGIKLTEKAGMAQYEKAKELYNNANVLVTGDIDFRHRFLPMNNIIVNPSYTDGVVRQTCTAAIGVSMLAGTQDGEGVGKQGVSCEQLNSLFAQMICLFTQNPCQGPKPVVMETGSQKPYPWTPDILPLQILKIGHVIILAPPVEVTTMTGRRFIETVKQEIPHSIVVISALSNAYAGYVATNEEYHLQRYEGASTHFGPWQAAALSQEFAKLAFALSHQLPVEKGPTPVNLIDHQIDFQTGVVFDDKPLDRAFGSVTDQVKPSYIAGETVSVTFIGGHPKNNYHTQGTFLEVQQIIDNRWQTVRYDYDWDTEYHWDRRGTIAYSYVTINWRTANTTPPGRYRIIHHGDWKSGWTGAISAYTGYSNEFIIVSKK